MSVSLSPLAAAKLLFNKPTGVSCVYRVGSDGLVNESPPHTAHTFLICLRCKLLILCIPYIG